MCVFPVVMNRMKALPQKLQTTQLISDFTWSDVHIKVKLHVTDDSSVPSVFLSAASAINTFLAVYKKIQVGKITHLDHINVMIGALETNGIQHCYELETTGTMCMPLLLFLACGRIRRTLGSRCTINLFIHAVEQVYLLSRCFGVGLHGMAKCTECLHLGTVGRIEP
jgi:hypothetical protein